MNPLFLRALPYLALLAALLAFFTGTHISAYRAGAQNERAKWLEKEAKATALAAKQVQEQQAKTEEITRQLLAKQKTINQLTKEKRDALYSLTTGRDCLSARAVGLLNRGSSAMPETAQLPAGTDTTEPAALGARSGATDTDVARWMADAQHQYSQAAAQCNALIDLVK